jgi:quercetin dioxygenase-like cupin family protein
VSESIFVPPAGGEIVGDTRNRRVEVLCDHEALAATWARHGPRREGADLHIHYGHTDMFYVLDGELAVRLGVEDEVVVVPAGTLARVPRYVVHGFRNASDEQVRFLNFHAPGMRFADFLRAMNDRRSFSWDQHDPPPDGGRPTSEAVVGGHEFVAGRPALHIALLADVEEIGISENWGEAGGPSPPAHLHPRHVESFYVLEGELTFRANGREIRAESGAWVQIPPGVPHTFAFTGDAPARFLNLHTPNCGYGAFLRGLHQARSDDELAAVRAAFDQVPAEAA